MAEHVEAQAAFLETELKPCLDAAQAGRGHVFFVDAAHFVFGTFLCCLWSFTRIFIRAASGRQRFNVLGAWNAVTRQLIAVTNTTVVNTETMCELLRKIAALGLTGPITLVLDNARYQHNAAVKALATQLGITLLFLPSYSPNLNLIERLWKFIKRRSLYGRYHPTFADFQAAIQETLDGLPTTHAEQLKTLMTLNFQLFDRCLTYGRLRYSSAPFARGASIVARTPIPSGRRVDPARAPMEFFTIGYGGRSPEAFLSLLVGHGVCSIADVRIRPDRASMGAYTRARTDDRGIDRLLNERGISYHHILELGNLFLDLEDWRPHYRELLRKSGRSARRPPRASALTDAPAVPERRAAECHLEMIAGHLVATHDWTVRHIE